jgi:NDP-sugar pyrophosphorylase family protein
MKAMIFAAGLGTRLQPYTLTKPKALVEINGITLLELSIRKLKSEGFSEIVVNVHAFGNQIIEFLKSHDFGIITYISDEREQLLDTGGGLAKAMHFFSDDIPFLVYNVDIITTVNLAEFYQAHLKSNAIASLMVRNRKTARYLLFNNEMKLSGWRNKSTEEEILVDLNPSETYKELAFSGIHIVNPNIASYFPAVLNPFPIVPFYLEVAKHETIKGVLDSDSNWFDVGKVEQLNEASDFIKANNLYL